MSSTQRNVLILVAVAALLVAALWFVIPPSKTKLGLDLQGGLGVVLEAVDSPNAPRTQDAMNQAVSIINDRINRLGVSEPEVQRQGLWKISVQLPGIENPDQALDIIGKTAVLEFWDVSKLGTPYPSEAEALKAAGAKTRDQLPKGTRIIQWPAAAGGTTGDQWFVVKSEPALTGSALSAAQVGFDQNNQPKVDMTFKSEGAKQFAQLTDTLAQRAQVLGTDQLLAIVLDGKIESAPRVTERIDGGSAEITGRFSLDEAKKLALVLKTGALPVELKPISKYAVGATLGKASLNQALFAGAVGLIIIMIFMLVVYRLLGLVADIALVIYGILYWGILNAIGVTLTLPSIAGAILTLGVALDANVIIFARVKEEVKAGKSLRTAVDTGFRKAFRAIFDSNMTTLITAAVLFFTAVGGVRGFALTLAVGVVLSMFTAVLVTRALLSLLARFKPFQSHTLLGLDVGMGDMKIWPLMQYRKYFMTLLVAVLVFGLFGVFVIGLTPGIDFSGGVRAQVTLDKPASTNDVRATFVEAGVKEPVVQGVGTNSYQITADAMSAEQISTAVSSLSKEFGGSPSTSQVEEVGPSFGEENTRRAILAVLVAMLGVVIYLSFRFEYKMAIAAIVALIHDVALTLGIYAVTGRAVTAATVAAILTVVGYSVMDTIIVFDRIRENTALMKKGETYADMVDKSIRQIVWRSVNTTLLTLIPVTCVLLFGGATLKDFAFALFIGIASGAYSSIFVASPLLVIWKEREARYRKLIPAEQT